MIIVLAIIISSIYFNSSNCKIVQYMDIIIVIGVFVMFHASGQIMLTQQIKQFTQEFSVVLSYTLLQYVLVVCGHHVAETCHSRS